MGKKYPCSKDRGIAERVLRIRSRSGLIAVVPYSGGEELSPYAICHDDRRQYYVRVLRRDDRPGSTRSPGQLRQPACSECRWHVSIPLRAPHTVDHLSALQSSVS